MVYKQSQTIPAPCFLLYQHNKETVIINEKKSIPIKHSKFSTWKCQYCEFSGTAYSGYTNANLVNDYTDTCITMGQM